MDYEYQTINHLAFRLATTVVVPAVFPVSLLRQQGGSDPKVIRYDGLKEELYIGDFEPDDEILAKVGICTRPRTVVVVRTPPSRAIYHPAGNPLFDDALRTICQQDDVACVVLARYPEQIAALQALQHRNCIVPKSAVDSRSLIYAADVVIGAGGTMTREAALMGIPTWTAFAGKPAAVDVWLERQGRLSRLFDAPAQLVGLEPRTTGPRRPSALRSRGASIERVLAGAAVSACGRTAQESESSPALPPTVVR
jgi:predicted glycosyltransferase